MAPHSSTLAWKLPWTEEPGGLQSMGSLRVGHNWATSLSLFLSCIGEGNGNPLRCSCLENPRDGGAWRLQSMGREVRHDWATSLSLFTFMHWRRKRQPTPVFLSGESQGRGRIPGTGEPGGLLSMGSHRVRHDWSDLAAAAAELLGYIWTLCWNFWGLSNVFQSDYTILHSDQQCTRSPISPFLCQGLLLSVSLITVFQADMKWFLMCFNLNFLGG